MTLQAGDYLVEYNANATNSANDATLAFYLDDTQISPTISTASLGSTTNTQPLTGRYVVSVPSGEQVLTIRNGGSNEFTVNNLSLTIMKLD